MMKCHYVYDEIAGKVLIPGCWPVAHSNDIGDCSCVDEAPVTYAQFERKRYNDVLAEQKTIIKQLKTERDYLFKENQRLNKRLEKLKTE